MGIEKNVLNCSIREIKLTKFRHVKISPEKIRFPENVTLSFEDFNHCKEIIAFFKNYSETLTETKITTPFENKPDEQEAILKKYARKGIIFNNKFKQGIILEARYCKYSDVYYLEAEQVTLTYLLSKGNIKKIKLKVSNCLDHNFNHTHLVYTCEEKRHESKYDFGSLRTIEFSDELVKDAFFLLHNSYKKIQTTQ